MDWGSVLCPLPLKFASLTSLPGASAAVRWSFLSEMISNEFNSLRKTFGIKIIIWLLFPVFCLPLELLGCCCMFLSCDACKKQEVSNYTWHNYANFTCIYDDQRLAFSISIQMVQSKISYIIYSLLSMPFFLFVVCFKVIFERLKIHCSYFKSYFNLCHCMPPM